MCVAPKGAVDAAFGAVFRAPYVRVLAFRPFGENRKQRYLRAPLGYFLKPVKLSYARELHSSISSLRPKWQQLQQITVAGKQQNAARSPESCPSR
jgi:hypothetical protein